MENIFSNSQDENAYIESLKELPKQFSGSTALYSNSVFGVSAEVRQQLAEHFANEP